MSPVIEGENRRTCHVRIRDNCLGESTRCAVLSVAGPKLCTQRLSTRYPTDGFICFLCRAAVPSSAVTLGVVEEAGRLGIKRLWLQPGSENDEVRGGAGQGVVGYQ